LGERLGSDADCSAWIERTPYPSPTALQHMRVDHGRTDVLVPQEFLHGANVVPCFEEMRGKRVAARISTLHILRRSPRSVIRIIPSLGKP
jgi:hypothetical protein